MTTAKTLADALQQYLEEGSTKLIGMKRRLAENQAERFVKWVKPDTALDNVRPYDVESFVNANISGHASDAADKVEGLRHFLEYLGKTSAAINLKKEAKVPRVKGLKRGTSSREETVVHQFTAEGHASLTAELEMLKNQRHDIQASIGAARADKDFRENAPLDAAREKQALHESRIKEIENLLKHAEIMPSGGDGRRGVHVGSTIIVANAKSGKEQRFTIVHPREVNPQAGKISIESPVGKAVLGKMPGDEVEVQAPSGMLVLTIRSIEY
ncbi:MAG: transcription elongation factor GreA [Dehalococcoidia bacterium]